METTQLGLRRWWNRLYLIDSSSSSSRYHQQVGHIPKPGCSETQRSRPQVTSNHPSFPCWSLTLLVTSTSHLTSNQAKDWPTSGTIRDHSGQVSLQSQGCGQGKCQIIKPDTNFPNFQSECWLFQGPQKPLVDAEVCPPSRAAVVNAPKATLIL